MSVKNLAIKRSGAEINAFYSFFLVGEHVQKTFEVQIITLDEKTKIFVVG